MGDNERYCYLSTEGLVHVLDAPRSLDAILKHLGVHLKANVRRSMSPEEKLDEIVAHTKRLVDGSKNSPWRHCSGFEVLAAAIWQLRGAGLGSKLVDQAFWGVRVEEDLRTPVANWLASQGLNVHHEIRVGLRQPDLLGHRKRLLRGHQFVAVELKNELREFGRAADQMTTYADYAHEVYVACTPAMAVAYLDAHARGRGTSGWDPQVFNRKLEKLGAGLLLVEGDRVLQAQLPSEHSPIGKNVDEVLAELERARRRS